MAKMEKHAAIWGCITRTTSASIQKYNMINKTHGSTLLFTYPWYIWSYLFTAIHPLPFSMTKYSVTIIMTRNSCKIEMAKEGETLCGLVTGQVRQTRSPVSPVCLDQSAQSAVVSICSNCASSSFWSLFYLYSTVLSICSGQRCHIQEMTQEQSATVQVLIKWQLDNNWHHVDLYSLLMGFFANSNLIYGK